MAALTGELFHIDYLGDLWLMAVVVFGRIVDAQAVGSVVGKGRLELPRLSAHDPKSCSSANSDTSPRERAWAAGRLWWVNYSIGVTASHTVFRLHCLEELAAQSAGLALLNNEVGGVVECHEAAHSRGDVRDEVVVGLDARLEVEVL